MIVARKILGDLGRLRGRVRVALLVIYLVIPWLTWNGRPFVLLDIAHRKFYFPGAVFWPQEFYYLLLVVMSLGLSLFLFTSLFGRMWCGWACPQTVYTELFDTVARIVSPRFGKASQKNWEKIVVVTAWVLLSAFLTFHFISYFVGARTMLSELASAGPQLLSESVWPYFWIAITGLFYFDLGIFRHNFCVYLCPYARFQSVMLDRDSLVIAYDSHRGDPKRTRKIKPGDPAEKEFGDCTGCLKCVQVCPTGIDIRNGLQVACINCAHCVDACREEMASYEKETLVGYSSLRFFEERKEHRFVRPRTLIYGTALTAVVAVFGILLGNRLPLNLSVIRDRTVLPFVLNNQAQNVYEVDVANMREVSDALELEAELLEGQELVAGSIEARLGENPISVQANELRPVRVIVQAPVAENVVGRHNLRIRFKLRSENDPDLYVERESLFTIDAPEATPQS